EAQPNTLVEMRLEYFNTSSSKCILDIFKRLGLIHELPGKKVEIKWYYYADDEDMYESGNDYSSIVKVPFELVPYSGE
ncbi:MAG: SiaC family regulatory phosphoprotein, partial [Bacteroides sp.]